MVRLLAFALNVPGDERDGALEFAKGMWDPDEPELWHKDLTGRIVHWIEVGQPEERRVTKASGRADRVSVYAFGSNAPAWWAASRAASIAPATSTPGSFRAEQSRALALLAERSMQLQINRQDGIVWVADGDAVGRDPSAPGSPASADEQRLAEPTRRGPRLLVRRAGQRRVRQRAQGLVREGRCVRCRDPRALRRADRARPAWRARRLGRRRRLRRSRRCWCSTSSRATRFAARRAPSPATRVRSPRRADGGTAPGRGARSRSCAASSICRSSMPKGWRCRTRRSVC